MKATARLSMVIALVLLTAPVSKAAPNIVFIMADDVGCETLGCYGGTSYKTPQLDRLATSGMRFTHCFAMPVCHPTRVCLLTGQYPFRLDNPKWGTFPKRHEKATFAHLLKKAGYKTAIAGKWQLTMMRDEPDHPHRLGFDEYCLFGWHEGPRYYQPMIYQNGKLRKELASRYGPDVYTDYLIDFMKRNKDHRFLAYYSMAFCHDVTDDLKAPVPVGPQGRYDDYREMLEGMDTRVGRIVTAVDELGLAENTIIVFTTDNGTPPRYIAGVENGKLVRKAFTSRQAGQDIVGGKGKLTDAGTNVPLIVRWPGKVKPGKVSSALVNFSDFYATMGELAEVKATTTIDGRSFLPVLRAEVDSARNWAFAEHRGKSFVRTRRWKVYDDGKVFDVQRDRLEQTPLAVTDEAEVKMLRRVHRELKR